MPLYAAGGGHVSGKGLHPTHQNSEGIMTNDVDNVAIDVSMAASKGKLQAKRMSQPWTLDNDL